MTMLRPTPTRPTTALDDQPVSVRARLAAAWTSVMFLYVYVDLIAFFKPGVIEDVLVGRVWEFDVSQPLLTTFVALMAVPIFMVVLSTALPARAARVVNLVVASVQVPFAVFNMAGGDWPFYYGLGVALEVPILLAVLWWAWTWPRTTPGSSSARTPITTSS